MQFTPDSNLYLERSKGQHYNEDCSDSGYSGFFHSPQSVSGVHSCSSLSPVECNESLKENLRVSVTPKGRRKDNSRATQQPSTTSWCETPKLYKRDASLRYRLLMSKPITDVKTDNPRSPYSRKTEFSISTTSENWLSASFDLLEDTKGTSASSNLGLEQDLALYSKERRILFSQVRTSTREDRKLDSGHLSNFEERLSLSDADYNESISASSQNNTEAPHFRPFLPASSKEGCQSPIGGETNILHDNSTVLSTPSYTHTPRCIRSVSEDSGFSSLALDKSQDFSVAHDGSYQELLVSDSRGNCETPTLGEAKRRPRFQRQRRLSTLKEGGSQSEEDSADRQRHRCLSYSKDVLDECFSPHSVLSLKCDNSTTSGVASVEQDCVTPVRETIVASENVTSLNTALTNSDVTPLRTTPVNLDLTPALQLVHAMCQQKAQMFAGQSPSLKEQLKYTAALAETPSMFRTTMPLSGLIGRKMGIGKVDILAELRKRNLRHILSVIFNYLTSESIHRCGQVCKCWNEIIHQDKRASFRRRNHLSEVEVTPEFSSVRRLDLDTRLALLNRSALKMIQAQSRTSSYCTPQSGNSTLTPLQHSGGSSKQEKFLEIAKTLFNDECLRPCPRCQHPARCHSVKGEGVCTSDNCGFKFCTACLCVFHGSRECGSQSVGRWKKDIILPGSAQSKRNVRRL